MSALGEGQPYFAICLIILSIGSIYEWNYFLIGFLQTLYFNHLLKMVHHAPRPYFDDPSLLDKELIDCAGEFGNPSAHATMAANFILLVHQYYKDKYSEVLKQKPRFLIAILDILVYTLILGIGLSRLHSGRHTMDQLLYGWSLGIWGFCFTHYYYKPYFYDPGMKVDANHWK
jgi:membrane-associated phospholipid phosphatase